MTAAAYTTDLATVDLAEGSTWVLPTATGWTATGTVSSANTESYIQGASAATRTYAKTGVGGLFTPAVTNFTVPTDGAVLVWFKWDPTQSIDVESNGGIRIMIGNSQAVFYGYKHLGKDSYLYGGWVCLATNDTVTPDYTLGSPSSPWQRVGVAVNNLASISKGEPMSADCVRVGRCEARFAGGTSPDSPCTFAGFATVNDANDGTTGYNRWGLIQAIAGGYLWQGLMVLGYGAAVDFRDSNKSITVINTKKVTTSFNRIEIRNASSRVDWTSISIQSTGTTSRGMLEVIDNADVNFDSCTFTDMNTFIFLSGSSIVATTFRRCGQITQGGATFDGCLFTNSFATVSLLVDNPDLISDCQFISDGSNHAIQLTAACAGNSYTLTDFYVSGYAASNGSTGNEVIYNNSGGAVTININGGSGVANISVRNGTGASTTLVAEFSFIIAGLELNTEVTIVTAGTSTVLFNAENATTSDGDGKYQVTYTHSGGGTVDVLIHHVNYKPDISNIINLTLPSSNSSTKVQMFLDENYYNPT